MMLRKIREDEARRLYELGHTVYACSEIFASDRMEDSACQGAVYDLNQRQAFNWGHSVGLLTALEQEDARFGIAFFAPEELYDDHMAPIGH